jgi:uncharacterized protein
LNPVIAHSMKTAILPVKYNERVIFMDVLRGFAILGIFIANLGSGLSGYNEDAHLKGMFLLPSVDHIMTFAHHLLIEGKFYTIFSILFGWGIALQIQRGEAKHADIVPVIRRRLLFMLLLGAFHLLIWPGDIVFFYALLGFVLLPLRRFSDRTLLISGAVLILLPVALYAAKLHWSILNAPTEYLYLLGDKVSTQLTNVHNAEEYLRWNKQAGWWDVMKSNIAGFFYRYGYLLFVSRIPKVLGAFLIGFVLGRSGFYSNRST